jgi:hypothetical protein
MTHLATVTTKIAQILPTSDHGEATVGAVVWDIDRHSFLNSKGELVYTRKDAKKFSGCGAGVDATRFAHGHGYIVKDY